MQHTSTDIHEVIHAYMQTFIDVEKSINVGNGGTREKQIELYTSIK